MKKQRGAALIVVLSLLTMSLMLGLSGMQSSQIDERLAGNYRSSALAMMAAEFGASEAWAGTLAVEVDKTSDSTFESALDSEVSLGDHRPVAGSEGAHPNVFFRIQMMDGVGLDIPLRATGEVFSDSARTDLVASREIEILARLNGLGAGNLSPLNIAATLENYKGMSSQAGVEGEEEVDGTRNPAISAANKEEAQKIVDDIVGKNGGSKYVFIENDDGSGDGTFYAAAAVNQDGDYTGNYSTCNSGQNRLIHDGVACQHARAAPDLHSADPLRGSPLR
ncbi:pilus assembly PilX family protein [Halomonas chromatireducens]|uniref:Type 4 fimbrial biogenesis protein PilX N-terminal domain-containing protein n=1 Tax=Halomonas chromatireducens TaxID=507626 RepID=A0A0X8HAX4_9GAMM|nr:PilX N-terminal domain-containing pilus assembly protein [Halomonas chromatireducens]AMC99279.1 hypothetical protein LOKO_00182 [Halomonas chromatireducens]